MNELFPTENDDGGATVEGELERVVFSNPETAWCVARFRLRDRSTVTAVGNLFGLHPGENVRLTGEWIDDKRYGRQLRVSRYLTVQPATVAGIRRYLGSGLVPGIGKVMAKRLVAAFGIETLDVIENEPHRLVEVDGIGRVRAERIQSAWKRQRAVQQVMIFLQTHGVSTGYATKIFRQYGDDAIRVVTEDPFRLAIDVRGIGFRTADQIAASLGLAPDAPARLDAGLLHTLSTASTEGHAFLRRDELIGRASELLEVDRSGLEMAVERLAGGRHVIVEPAIDGVGIYLASLFLAERGLATRLRRLGSKAGRRLTVDPEAECRRFEARHDLVLAPEQRTAILRALGGKIVVVTGGPGTGKTTLVRAIVDIATRSALRVKLAAPTGRAAKRLQEASGIPASTIHRLLEFTPKTGRFARDDDHPLDADLLVVDEVSMVDCVLANSLVRALPAGCRLVLVGDSDQLPSIGPGAVLADLVASGVVDVVRLDRVFRQGRESLIVTNAHRMLSGQHPRLPVGADGDFFVIEREEPDAVIETVGELVSQRIPGHFGFDPNDLQVLSPMRRGPLGTHALNASLQALLNPDGDPAGPAHRQLRIGDRVIQTRNDYQLEVFNGDIGRVTAWDEEDSLLTVAVDGRDVVYEAKDLDALELAYACSIHKSQGSEYPALVLVLHGQHWVMLQRSLIYTAVTRGRRLVVVVGQRRAIARAIANDRQQHRNTWLAERLRAD